MQVAQVATACGASGTRCGRFIFIFAAGDFPYAGCKFELRPFRRAKLAGAHEGECEQFERRPRSRCALIALDIAKKPSKAFGSMIAARWLTTGARGRP